MDISFDRIEDLARTMCEAAGSDWAAKGTRRNYWRAKAGEALASADRDSGDGPRAWIVVALVGWSVALGALCALLARAPS